MGSQDSSKGHHGLSPSFSAVKSLLSMAKMGGLSRNSLSLEGRSLLRAGTGLGLMAEAVPWSYTHLTPHRKEAGKRGLRAPPVWVLSWGLLQAPWIQLSWSSLIKVVHAHYWSLREHK